MFNNALKTAFAAVIGSAFLLAGGCGKSATDNQFSVGPVGPTKSGYYFKVMVAPELLRQTGWTTISVWVTHPDGTAVDGTRPPAATITPAYIGTTACINTATSTSTSTGTGTSTGTSASIATCTSAFGTTDVLTPLKVYLSGEGVVTSSSAPVDANGYVYGNISLGALPGVYRYTITLEDRSVIVPVQVMP